LGVVLGAFQADNRSAGLSADLGRIVRLSNLFCASKERTGDVRVELGLAATVTTDVKCSDMFQDASSGTLGCMTEEATQMHSMVLVDDDSGDGLEQCTDVPIQQDLDVDDDTPVGAVEIRA
jgi:hypothetical protein